MNTITIISIVILITLWILSGIITAILMIYADKLEKNNDFWMFNKHKSIFPSLFTLIVLGNLSLLFITPFVLSDIFNKLKEDN